jgi:N-methylhydantoinase B
MLPPAPNVDPVSLKIFWDRLISIADEGVSTLIRTAFSTVVREAYDLSVVLLDTDGELLAQSTQSIPSFTGSAPATLAHMLAAVPSAELRPGDVVVTNDPWMGTGHTYDINVMAPVFRDGRLVAYALSITHLPDIGGTGFGAGGTEIYHEGLRIPVCKLFDAGRRNEFIFDLIRYNVRVAEQVVGDVLANVACVRVIDRQVNEFMTEYRIDDLTAVSRRIRGVAEAAMRDRIAAMRDGIYRAALTIEGVDAPVTLRCAVTVRGDSVAVDYAGTDPCVPHGINVPFCFTVGYTLHALKCIAAATIPNNGGSTRPVSVSAPEGCILDARPPHAVAARHAVGWFLPTLLFRALKDAAPDQVQADSGMINMVNFRGTHRNGRPVTTLHFASGGFGAAAGYDGAPTLSTPSSNAAIPVEVWEATTGITVTRKALRENSGGAGAARGGDGQEVFMRNDTGHDLVVDVMGYRTDYPAEGLFGGGPGAAREIRVNGRPVPRKGRFVLRPGDTLERYEAGGGGFGRPD